MKKQIVALIATLMAVTGLAVVNAGPASADTPGCVTRYEYRQVERGMPRWRVHALFDTKGVSLGRYVVLPGYWETDYDAYQEAWDEWYAAEPEDPNSPEYFEWLEREPFEEDFQVWRPAWVDIVRSYRKCGGFDDGRGRVGINYDNYSFGGTRMRVFEKVRWNPWSLVWW